MKSKKFVYIFCSIFIPAIVSTGIYLSLTSWRIKTYTYNQYEFQYDSNTYSIESTEPTKKNYPRGTTPINGGTLFLQAKDYSIEFYLMSERIPNSDAFTWVGYGNDDLPKYFDYVVDNTRDFLPSSINADVLTCNKSLIDEDLFCNLLAKNNVDGKYYLIEERILDFRASQIALSFSNLKTFDERVNHYSEIKEGIKKVMNASKIY